MAHRIVVGVDGSACSRLALHWAAREARIRGATLVVVTAWTFPPLIADVTMPPTLEAVLREQARQILDETLAELGEETRGLAMERLVVEGDPAHRLIELSNTADLLVVGSRGLGGFRELLLGSVSHRCAAHAACPVVVVRHLGTTG
jgi:nucleotide-binding universal stress UspA family protein